MKTILWLILIVTAVSCVEALQKNNHPRTQTPLDKEADIRLERATQMRLLIKRNLRDPDSVKWESVYTNKEGTVGCFIYRARNRFGGMNREHAAIYANAIVDWNKYCKGQSLYSIDILAY